MIRTITRSVMTACRYYSSRYCSSLMEISPAAELDAKCLTITESFVTPLEQDLLMEEIELAVGRVKYSYDHWDDVSIA